MADMNSDKSAFTKEPVEQIEESNSARTVITDEDVLWMMEWDREHFPNKPPTELIFEVEQALARLLAEEVIRINNYWLKSEWPEHVRKLTALQVGCNDIFAWGCSDSEELEYKEIRSLYDMWHADREWGAAKWCAIKRKQQPQRPVIDSMKAAGSWDATMEALGENTLDAEMHVRMSVFIQSSKDKQPTDKE
jgi:hypothetical protein